MDRQSSLIFFGYLSLLFHSSNTTNREMPRGNRKQWVMEASKGEKRNTVPLLREKGEFQRFVDEVFGGPFPEGSLPHLIAISYGFVYITVRRGKINKKCCKAVADFHPFDHNPKESGRSKVCTMKEHMILTIRAQT